ncbi:ureidoglycolate lyase [Xanthobacter sp. V3C-3]|uniref:ureidoglycolate lyase n=1 Tax=Xanthobacter lutulentifluminis TaxID=3119935 RepID=UPI00372C5436
MSLCASAGRAARTLPLAARPLTAEAFAPYGAVLATPETAGVRTYFDAALGTLAPQAPASLSIVRAAPVAARPVPVAVIERHPLTPQTFLPMAPARWLVVVAPDAPDGGPDLERAEAFLPPPGAGITFGRGVWHAPLTVLDAEAAFAILMWRDWSPNDEEFAAIVPFAVTV